MAENKLEQYLLPILGEVCTMPAIRCLEELNPELKGNEKLVDKFIKEVDKVPDADKNYMVAGAIKLSKIKNVLAERGDNSQFADSYKDFENITTRLLKNLYNIGKYADTIILDESVEADKRAEVYTSPAGAAATIMFNDRIHTSIPQKEVEKEFSLLVGSSAGGIEQFPLLVEYIAERSAQTAEIKFNHEEYDKFSKWLKDRDEGR